MHDPFTLAFEIYLGSKKKNNGNYRTPLISIWHKDPCADGTDSSCGWYIRARHVDKKLRQNVLSEFEFNFKHNYWFNEVGISKFSTPGLVLNMYKTAAWHVFMFMNGGKPDSKRCDSFLKKNLYEIMIFAENPTDSLSYAIDRCAYEKEYFNARHFSDIVLSDVMRKLRPWYKHPRWHIHHWEITFPLFGYFYRKWFVKPKPQDETKSNYDPLLRDLD